MSAPDRIWAWVWNLPYPSKANGRHEWNTFIVPGDQDVNEYLRADGPTITAYREALRTAGLDPDSIARESDGSQKTAQPDQPLLAEAVALLREAHSRIGVHIAALEPQGSIMDASKKLHGRIANLLGSIAREAEKEAQNG